MNDPIIKQWSDTFEVLRKARAVGELVVPCVRRALSSNVSKADALQAIAAIREVILALAERCADCGKELGEDESDGRMRLCNECANERDISERADAADRAYDAWKDGER